MNILAQACINIGHLPFSSEKSGCASSLESAAVRRFLQAGDDGNGVHLRDFWDWDWVYIHFFGSGCWRFRFYSESLSKSAKVTKALLPLHSVPRLGSACPHSGIAPGARRHRPSMAGGGYRGILAAVPPAQRLRSASGKGAVDLKQQQDQDQDQDQDQKIAAFGSSYRGNSALCRSELARDEFEGNAFFQTVRVIVHVHREQARSHKKQIGVSLWLFTTQQAER
ncbi:hypothetical protein JFU37_07030 [Pseudomonas sp. TH41]|uniref:hypothetical protein n=1 Tax=Pseudomonas sp. TH41 TaxID=2796405 RepID=UPI001914A52B|nr:hypothetical protein [Pseudomonas sp. TH41]MBK5352260.1 hypothetical protein [Pseudomonas sp. TH41]